MPVGAALDAAREAGMDLVEVSPNQEVPVVKILDYGKLRFEERKKKAAAKKKQKSSELKEIKMRPNIDTHDYEVKAKAMARFFESGDKVKVTLRFRGREMAHQHLGMELLQRVKEDFEETAKAWRETDKRVLERGPLLGKVGMTLTVTCVIPLSIDQPSPSDSLRIFQTFVSTTPRRHPWQRLTKLRLKRRA